MSPVRLRPLCSAALLVGALGVLALTAPAALASLRPAAPSDTASAPPPPTAQRCDGHRLKGASVPAGTCVIVSAEGFRPGEAVTARLLSSATRTVQVRADRTGTVRYQFQASNPSEESKPSMSSKASKAPKSAPDVLTLVESVESSAASPGPRLAASGNVTVTVPRFAIYRFTVTAA
ncbi:MAG: hypothetical protein JWO63_1703 [Frankiales bacterium]|jgi:hypothetical protein|nr:hypothetical protein [Frankiales bacterium]